MKKVLLIAAVAGLSMVSCKKKYTCECTTTYNGTTTTSSGTSSEKMKKKDAEAECNKGDASITINGQTSSTECSLK